MYTLLSLTKAICIILLECVDLYEMQWRKGSQSIRPKHPSKESKHTKIILLINPDYSLH